MQQLTPLATYSALSHYWAIITHEGLSGLVTIKQPLAAALSDCLAAHVTILYETSMFLLIIHDHRQKIAIPGHIYPGTTQPYHISLDGWPVDDSMTLLTIVQKYR
ncbi:hypothetical protein RXV91_05875 [Lactiplantibacillus sp. DA1]|uniref:hypothetical protein n=1 Tax=Lactiplantibacillus sp. DA1 TaxID=3079857 RepID=UPI00292A610D|nr:hypothetical protein [Lactiplantibacillus sp. DA1]MDV0430402.1 hypothetical protein [Lactiplantibacillus sp. DA1]